MEGYSEDNAAKERNSMTLKRSSTIVLRYHTRLYVLRNRCVLYVELHAAVIHRNVLVLHQLIRSALLELH